MGSGLAKPHGVRRLLSHRSSTSAAELSCPQPLAKSTESKPAEPLVKKSCLPALSQESFAEAKSLLTEAAKVGQSDALLPYADRLVLSLRTLKSKENVNSEVVGELLAFLQSQMAPEIRQSQPDFAHQWATRIAESKFANFVPQWLLSSASFQFAPDHPQVYHCRLVLQILRDAAELSGGEMVAKICRFGLIGMLLGLLTKEHFTEEKIKTSPTIELVGLTVASLLHICFRRQFQETRWLFNSGNGVVKFLPLASVSSESSDLRAMTAVLLAYGICPNQIAFLFSPVCILYVVLKLLRRAIESKDRRIAGLTVQEITEAIAVAAVNDEVKTKLPKFGGLEIIQSLIERPGNETELTATVKTIWILSFSPQMHDRLRNVAGLLQS